MQLSRKPLPALTGREKNTGFFYLIFQFFFLPSLLRLPGSLFSVQISEALINFLYFSINFVSILVIFSKFLLKNLLRLRKNPKEVLLIAVLGFAGYWLCSALMSLLLKTVFPGFVNLNNDRLITVFKDAPALMLLGTVIFAPWAEEVLHRGLVFGTLTQKSLPLAYCSSALLFAAIHVVQYAGLYSPGHLALALVQYLPAGFVFAWAYQRSGCILAPILIHAANNIIAMSLMR